MIKNNTFNISYGDDDLSLFSDIDDSKIKFDLFVRSRQMTQIYEQLLAVLSLDNQEKRTWIRDNEELISNLLSNFIDDTVRAMNGINIDDETKQLSMDLVTKIRDSVDVIKYVFEIDDLKKRS
jgi:hypothetical protein